MIPQKLRYVTIAAVFWCSLQTIPCVATDLFSVTGFGGVITERAWEWDGQTAGVSLALMKVLEVETGLCLNTLHNDVDWFGNVSLRLQSPSALSRWFAPYLIFGAGKYGTQSTNSAGFGLTLTIVRLDYRYIWLEQSRQGINRAYVGLELEVKNWP